MNARRRLRVGYLLADPGVDLAKHEGGRFHVEHIVGGLRDAGHEVRFVAIQPGEVIVTDVDGEPEREPARAGGVELSEPVRAVAREHGFAMNELVRSDRVFRAACRVFDGCDLVHARLSPFDVGGMLCARELGIPRVVEANAPPVEEALHYYPFLFERRSERLARSAARWTLESADAVLAVSSPLRDMLVASWGVDPARATVLPNAADPLPPPPSPARLAELRKRFGLGSGAVVLFVGALQPWHGLDALLEGFDRVRARHPEARLVIVGDGVQRTSVEKELEARRLHSCVRLTGRVEHAEVPEFLALADVTVAPYPRLPLPFYFSPIKLFEYMAAGTAIVASRIGQIAEVLADGETALLVEPGDVGQFAAALDRALGDPALRRRLGENARRKAEREHTWSRYVERLVEIYEGLPAPRS